MFFSFSKIFWALAQPLNAFCLLALAGLIIRLRWKSAGQGVMTAALSLILIFGLLPIGPWAVTWLENRYSAQESLPADIDGIIVLGGAFEPYLSASTNQLSVNDQADRLLCFIDMARKYPKARLVFTGGSGDILHPDTPESNDARALFGLARLDRDVIYEEKSRNTYENALYSKDLVHPKEGENWLLITSAYHMPRSVGIFEKMDWSVIPYPCDPKTDGTYKIWQGMPNVVSNYYMLNLATKELIGGAVYYFTGKSAFILP